MKVKSYGLESFSLDKEEVNVRYLEQLLDSEQVTALAYLLRYGLEEVMDGKKTVRQVVEQVGEGRVEAFLQLLHSLRSGKAQNPGALCLPEPVQRMSV